MSGWPHRHVLDLASFSREDFAAVLELAQRFRSLPVTGARKLPALQGRLVATLFFEPSTRTRSSFELAAKRNGKLCSVDKANVLEVSQLLYCRLTSRSAALAVNRLASNNSGNRNR